MGTEIKQIMEKLNHNKSDFDFIKEHLSDVELSKDDKATLNEAEKDFSAGDTKRLN